MKDLVRDPDVVEAMKGVPRFSIDFDSLGLARELWTFGEEELIDSALAASDDDLHAIRNIASVYYWTRQLPPVGQKIQLGHTIAFAGVAYFEGNLRPLAHPRRRPLKNMPSRLELPPPGTA